jgi:peptidoglycan/xylan/chitin deacetylase (PgdA/CDA1 family)
VKRLFSLLLIPMSALPIVGAVPLIVDSHARFQRAHNMEPLAAPRVGLDAAERARYRPFASPPGTVPVLGWHGIGPARDGYTTSAGAFARQLALLERLGYTAISTRQWAQFRAGRTAGLPAKPILLTFDDGRLDSYRGADAILERTGMRAAIFVITGEIDKRNPFYLTWAELHRMQDSGRWDVEPHAHDGHVVVPVSADGRRARFYAARGFSASQGRETLAGWEARVSTDLFTLRERFAAHGLTPHAFAVPFGDYGQRAANDRRIPALLGGLLTRQFGSYFVQDDHDDPDFTTPGNGAAERYELRAGTTLEDLYGWLRRHSEPDDEKRS